MRRSSAGATDTEVQLEREIDSSHASGPPSSSASAIDTTRDELGEVARRLRIDRRTAGRGMSTEQPRARETR